jgi:hypothetical protein
MTWVRMLACAVMFEAVYQRTHYSPHRRVWWRFEVNQLGWRDQERVLLALKCMPIVPLYPQNPRPL